MSIDADAELANLPKWSVTLDGKKYFARPVSWPAYRRFEFKYAAAVAAKDTVKLDDAYREALTAAFPPRWADLLRLRPSIPTRILNLTPGVRQKVLEDFFDHLASSATTAPTRSSAPSASSEPAFSGA